ncbi:VPS28-domain-containing protein [Polyplosphaeria fusca]|uniref:VPS28-domain-containing protein n=1 Tax=Polyplosphaeria fusca TaxID=682080 RepID=A0A9P4R634_9PLEO|nr:VPS28-domain-containing protein [Polyplosphaeria fusca]
MYGNRQQAYAPTPYIPRSSLSATINLDEEVKLSTNSAERDLYDSLAEIYSIITTLEALEKAYLKDSIAEGDYTETCSRLLKQYKSNLANETVARAFGDLESFKREWDMECPRATERLRVGIPATVEQGPSHKGAQQGENKDAMLVVAATEHFITLLDACKIGMMEKDTLHPLLVDIIQAVNNVTDQDFENKGKIIQWLITLNQMRAAEKLNEDQAREHIEEGLNKFTLHYRQDGLLSMYCSALASFEVHPIFAPSRPRWFRGPCAIFWYDRFNPTDCVNLHYITCRSFMLYTKPSANDILDALALLTSAPPSWDFNDSEEHNDDTQTLNRSRALKSQAVKVNPEGVTSYLTSIVGSSLDWIEDENVREEIWNKASLRLSERSGRTAMGAISRRFEIPSLSGPFELAIHEPALTGDDLGLKTWAASYLLAKRLHTFDLPEAPSSQNLPVLELGSGTGLVGLAMAGLGANVILTDLPSIHSNLALNIQTNSELLKQNHGSARSGVLDWTKPSALRLSPLDDDTCGNVPTLLAIKFPLILAADSLYSAEHPQLLVDTIETWLSNGADAQVIVEFPLRGAYLPEISDFRARMCKIGLHIVNEGEENGYDDWGFTGTGIDDDEKSLVRCWWSQWGRTGT